MASNTFTRYPAKNVGTTPVSVMTVPASTSTTIIGIVVANTSASPITADVYLTIGGVDYYIVKGATISNGGSLIVSGGEFKICANAGDVLKVVTSANNSADVIASVLQIA